MASVDTEQRIAELEAELATARAELAEQRRCGGSDLLTAALHESEQRFRSLFDASRDAVMILDPPDWRFTAGNPAAVSMFGARDEAHFTCLGPWEVSPKVQPDGADSATQARAMIEAALRHGSHFFEWTHRRVDGSTFPATVLLSRTQVGAATFLQATVRDVTEAKAAEAALRAHGEALEQQNAALLQAQAVLDGAPIMIVSKSAEDRCLGANAAFAAFAGLSPEEVLGRSTFELVRDPAMALRIRETDLAVLRSGTPIPNQLARVSGVAGREPLWTLQSKLPLRDARGEIVGTVGYLVDVDERVRAQERMLEAEARYRRVLETTLEGFCELDLDGRLRTVNPGMADIFGYSQAEMIGMSVVDDLSFPEDRGSMVARLTCRSDVARVSYDKRFRAATGEDRWLLVSASALRDVGGEATGFFATLTDITLRKQVEAALRESEERARVLFEHAADCLLLIEVTPERGPVIRGVNGTTLTCLGYTLKDLIDQPAAFIDADGEAGDRPVRTPDGMGHTFVSRHRCKDGTTREFECSATQLTVGGRTYGLWVERDITERKRVEDALSRSEAIQAKTLANIGDVIVIIDAQLKVRYKSPNITRLFGWQPEEIVGQRMWANVHPDDRARGRQFMDALSRQPKTSATAECRYLCKDGSYTWIEFTGVNLLDDPDIRGILGNYRDISARKRAEEALRASERFFEESLRAALIGSYRADFVAGVWESSEVLDHILGIDADYQRTIAGWLALVYPEDAEVTQRYLAEEVIGLGHPFVHDYRIVRHDTGEVRWVHGRGRVELDAGGRAVALIGTIQDITESRRADARRAELEAQLHQSQKMESVGRLAGGVAHDFNNMLGVIIGHAELALEQVDLHSTVRYDLEEIGNAAQRSADLTRQLLAFARKQTISPEVLELNATVDGMVGMLRRLIGENIEMVWTPGRDVGLVKIDPSQLDQILVNLTVNARDAIAGVGRVCITTENVTFDAVDRAKHPEAQPGDYVRLSFVDNGCGMDHLTRARLFEPFFTTKAMGKGTGLGLAMVYGIIQQNQGFILVESEPGRGTTFQIHLARHAGTSVQPIQEEVTPLRGRRHGTVLVVEDEAAILQLAHRMLAGLGYRVLAAGSPREALRCAELFDGEIHLLLTDVIMPEMNGRELGHDLRSLHPAARQLYMSGYTADVIAHHGVLDPGVDFIQKPFSLQSLADAVERALGRAPSA